MDPSQPSTSTQHNSEETPTLERDTDARVKRAKGALDIFKDMTDYEKERYVNRLIFVLWYSEKAKVPVRRNQLIAVLHRHFVKAFVPLMRLATFKLEAILHVTVKEIRKDMYILSNMLRRPYCDGSCMPPTLLPREEGFRQKLRTIVLTIIFMNGGAVEKSLLYRALEKLRFVDTKGKPDAFFGRQMTCYVRQAYIKEVKTKLVDPPLCEFRFGERALVEYRKEDLLLAACTVYRTQPDEWYLQFKEVQKDREERGEPPFEPPLLRHDEQLPANSDEQLPESSDEQLPTSSDEQMPASSDEELPASSDEEELPDIRSDIRSDEQMSESSFHSLSLSPNSPQ